MGAWGTWAPSYCDLDSQHGARACWRWRRPCDLYSGHGVRACWSGAAVVISAQGVALVRVGDTLPLGFAGNVWTVCALGILCAFGMALPLLFTGNVWIARVGDGAAVVICSQDVMSGASCPVVSCHVMSCHVASCRVMSSQVMSCCDVMPCHFGSCHVTTCHVTSCHAVPCRVMSRLVLSRCVVSRREKRLQHINYIVISRKRTPLTLTQLIFIPLAFVQLTLTLLSLIRPRSPVYQP